MTKSMVVRAMAVALLSVGGGAALLAHGEGKKKEMHVLFDSGSGDRVEIDDLDSMEIGDSRSYPAESGKTVVVTRDEKGYELDLDGKKIRIGGDEELLGLPGHPKMRMKRIEVDGDGEAKSFVIGDAPERDVMIFHGDGEHGFAFGEPGALLPRMGADGLLDRLAKNEKFRSLDDATQELVREAIRESSPEMLWMKRIDGEAGDGATKIIVRKRDTSDSKDDE